MFFSSSQVLMWHLQITIFLIEQQDEPPQGLNLQWYETDKCNKSTCLRSSNHHQPIRGPSLYTAWCHFRSYVLFPPNPHSNKKVGSPELLSRNTSVYLNNVLKTTFVAEVKLAHFCFINGHHDIFITNSVKQSIMIVSRLVWTHFFQPIPFLCEKTGLFTLNRIESKWAGVPVISGH